jgi:hypothetical protein
MEAREARSLAFLAAFEVGFERFVHTLEDILKDLGIDLFVLTGRISLISGSWADWSEYAIDVPTGFA